jgi:subtilisin family serine protease
MTGTSVAAAYAAGAAGLMLAINPRLSAREITEIVTRTAKPLPGADYGWRDDSGFGCLDIPGCLHETRVASSRKTVSLT